MIGFMSPEMQNGVAVGTASDIWGAGIVFGFLLKNVIDLNEVAKFGSPYLTIDHVTQTIELLRYVIKVFSF